MNRIPRSAMLPALLILGGIAQCQDIGAKVDQYIEGLLKQNRFSGAILLAKEGKVVHSKAYGQADRELNVPNTTATKFRLGSITKQFTAVAILQLAEKKKLTLDETAAKYIPDSHEGWKKVTIRHLLQHTSGMPSFTGFPDYSKFKVLPGTGPELIARFKDKDLEFEPGSQYRYSNSGYYLLGYIVEQVSGMSYENYLRANIFDPLGMSDTRCDSNATIIARRASGYTSGLVEVQNATYIDMSVPGGAGNMISTVEDLFRWDRALYTDKVLSKASRDAMFTPGKNNYGFGWAITRSGERLVIGHGGGIDGFNTQILRYPEQDAVLIALSNINTEMPPITRELEAILFGQ
jgi:CubicO group peptidase (beta-lactamase class C family)